MNLSITSLSFISFAEMKIQDLGLADLLFPYEKEI